MADQETVAGSHNGLNDALELVLEHDELADLDAARRRLAIRSLLIQKGRSPALVAPVAAIVDGYGVLDELMRDANVTDILVNRCDDVWIERDGRLAKTDVAFRDEAELLQTIERFVARSGGRVDVARPITDVALPDGSRLHVVLPPISPDGPKMSIRRFPAQPLTLADLEERGMFDNGTHGMFLETVSERRTVAISGGTGSGKTTLLNALLSEIAGSERLVTIEEVAELDPACEHRVALLVRPPNVERTGEVTLTDLMRAALRMRPDRIVVGEVRGPEALIVLDALSTGHAGSMVTVHAKSAAHVGERFVALGSTAGTLSEATLRNRFENAFDVIVHLERVGGHRRVVEVLRP